jgi:hypothetical protein
MDMEEMITNPKEKVWTKAAIQTAHSLGYSKKGSQKPGRKKIRAPSPMALPFH